MKKYAVATSLIVKGLFCFGQAQVLPEVVVSASKVHISAIEPVEYAIDSLALRHADQYSLAELLRLYQPAHVRIYGPGLISTVRVRGQGSEHFKVIWNGLSLNSAALGLFDFSGVPSAIFDQVHIHHGNLASFYGSGSGSGALVLNDIPARQKMHINTVQSLGSFGYQQRFASIGFSAGKWSVKVSNQLQYAANNYIFKNLSNQPQRLANSGYQHYNLTTGASYRINEVSAINLSIWNQKSFIGIPPSRVESRFNTSHQWNENLRSVLHYSYTGSRIQLAAGGGAISERIVYHNDILQLKDTSKVTGTQWFARGAIVANNRSKINFNAEHHSYRAPSPSRKPDASTTIYLLSAGYEYWLSDKLQLSTTLREEWQDGAASPLIVRFAGQYAKRKWAVQATGGNHFRWPTLNERFWIPGGNPDILPESGWTADASVSFSEEKSDVNGKIIVTPFLQSLENQIMWQPIGTQWSPLNLRKTLTTGIESRLEGQASLSDRISVHMLVNYTYCRSVVRSSSVGNADGAIGKLAIYSPQHLANAHLGLITKNWNGGIQWVFQSSQHTLSDNHPSGVLPGFSVLNLLVSRFVQVQHFTFRLSGEVRNLTGKEYEYIPHRPMPGREYRLTLQIQFTNYKYKQT